MRLPLFPRWQVELGAVVLVVASGALWLHRHDSTVRADALASQTVVRLTAVRDTARDTVHVVERRIVVDTQRVVIRKLSADSAVQKFDSAAHALQSVADTSHTGTVPIALALPPVETCNDALAKKDALIAAKDAELFDVGLDRDSWKKIAVADDSIAKLTPHPSGVGVKEWAVRVLIAGLAYEAGKHLP